MLPAFMCIAHTQPQCIYVCLFTVRIFMTQIVTGMRYLHQHSILHRDLSLTNLLLTQSMTVKIADFGLAAQLSSPTEQHYTMCGTPNYISPYVIYLHMLYIILLFLASVTQLL